MGDRRRRIRRVLFALPWLVAAGVVGWYRAEDAAWADWIYTVLFTVGALAWLIGWFLGRRERREDRRFTQPARRPDPER